jgi:large subunit ribosomal protein L1
MRRSKRFTRIFEKIDRQKEYSLEEGVKLLKETASAKFDETVEIAMRLGVDPRHADQMVRGTVALPNGTGKKIRVLALTKGDNTEKAKTAGADYVGLEEYIEKIQGGWLEFDVVVASPDVMAQVGKLGKILGTRGLMPNPKSGTVSANVATAVKEIKAGIIHSGVGKISFEENKLIENIRTFIMMVIRLKPTSAKGIYLKSIAISSTMGPGIFLDKNINTYTS